MRHFLLFTLLFGYGILFAQPANDECLDAIVLSNIDSYCSAAAEFDNISATTSTGYPLPMTCTPAWTGDQRDVWFTFTVPLNAPVDYLVEVNGNTMSMPQVAIYRGTCAYLAELYCAAAPIGANNISLEAIGLDDGEQYWIRVNDWDDAGGSNEGDFQLCISELILPINMMNGSSTNCQGILFDSGGPTGNYLNNENYTYTICPSEPHACLVFDFSVFDIENNIDFLRVYDGPNNTAPLVAELTGTGTNATIEAGSGCATLVWSASFTNNAAGWEATWACSNSPCSPNGSGISPPDLVDCSGDFFDSGLDTAGYLANENWEYSICPNVPNSCIILELDQYEIIAPDALSFYDGPDSSFPLIETVNGTGQNKPVFASSGCMTVAFSSNFQINSSGWEGSFTCTADACPVPEPMVVNPNVTGQQLIDEISAPGVVVLNVDTTGCFADAIGIFTTSGVSEIGIDRGIVLASGLATNAEGPNNDAGFNDGTNFGAPGDATLEAEIGGDQTFDACALEFDVYAATDKLTFNYVFGSEEYPEFAPPQGSINDAFGFFISGPGIVGEQNIALIPGTMQPVSINNINPVTNNQYYVDNALGITTEYDGFTTVLTAEAIVVPCDTYHLKLVIADVSDGILDSGVFIEAGSLTSGVASIEPSFDFSPDLDYTIEGCAEASMTISLNEAQQDTVIIFLEPAGSATEGVDYSTLPDSLIFLPGETSIEVPFDPVFDGVIEGDEQAVIYLTQTTNCGEFVYDSAVVDIHDSVLPEFTGYEGGDTLSICKGDSIQLIVGGGVDYQWSPAGVFSDPTIFNPYAFPDEDMWVYNTAFVASCTGIDSLYIQVRDIEVNIPFGDSVGICSNDLIQLESNVNVPGGTYSWEPAGDVIGSPPTVPNPAVLPSDTTTYYVTYTLDGCPNTDSIVVNINDNVPLFLTADTTVCAGFPVTLGNTPNGASYTWTPATGLNNPNIANPVATPTQTTTYTVNGVGGGGSCMVTGSVTVTVEAGFEIFANDDATICVGDSTQLEVVSAETGDYFWAPSATVTDPYTPNPLAFPTMTTTYLVSLDNGTCTVYDSTTVTVLTELPLELQADTTVCEGESVILGEPGFPGATYSWTPTDFLDDPDIPNPLATPLATTTYTVNASNGFCDSQGDVTVTVLGVPTVNAGNDQAICEGSSADLLATGSNGTTFTWTPSDGTLSCEDCPDPTASPTETTTYYLEYANSECSAVDSIIVFVDGTYEMNIDPISVEVYQGDTASLTAIPTLTGNTPLGDISYEWTPTTGILVTDAATVVVAPLETTTYTVSAISQGGCAATADVVVTILPPQFAIPNAFSPNGDGRNEMFGLQYVGNLDIQTFQIFDRWGELIFNNENPAGWDGTYEGEKLPQEAYIYYLVVVLPDGTQEVLTGDVTLLR